MNKINSIKFGHLVKTLTAISIFFTIFTPVSADILLSKEVKITDSGLFFNGNKVASSEPDNGTDQYDYFFGSKISAHGDSIKTYKNFVFMTWYQGGKDNRHVMLSRYNMETGSLQTIQFPHQHTGYQGRRHIGESHNTIAVAISSIDETIHLLYDMHAYSETRPSDGSFSKDYFRYSYSVAGLASLADDQFTLDKFIIDTSEHSEGADDYKHLSLTGVKNNGQFSNLTYPTFFENTDGTLLMYMRKGGNNNGGYVFSSYDAQSKTWSDFTQFNVVDAKNDGAEYNWGLYGSMKYVNGKLRVGFQQRSGNNDDKYQYQNGFYYGYSDHPNGISDWKNHQGVPFTRFPLVEADEIKIAEPGDLVSATGKNEVYIVSGFDWNVTEKGDVHFIGKVKDQAINKTINVHTYKPAGTNEFITTTDFAGADNIYTSGDDIYIIGLTSAGFPYVEKGQGGTNNFTRVYEDANGRHFNHGKVHISDGKLYYYLMERSTGSAQPLYLQIIDLAEASNPVEDDGSNQEQPVTQPETPTTSPPEIETPVTKKSSDGGSIGILMLLATGLIALFRRKLLLQN